MFIESIKQSPYKIVQKAWGQEEWLANSPLYCLKRLIINPNWQTSLHCHEIKVESLYVLGPQCIEVGDEFDEFTQIQPNVCFSFQPYQFHQFRNTHPTASCMLLEVSTQHFESDIIRKTVSVPLEQKNG